MHTMDRPLPDNNKSVLGDKGGGGGEGAIGYTPVLLIPNIGTRVTKRPRRWS